MSMPDLHQEEPSRVVHVYGVVSAGVTLCLPGLGIDETDVEVFGCGRFGSVFGLLDENKFGLEAWTQHSEDPRWLAPVATAHHAVLQAIVQDHDVLPLRLPGIYRDVEGMAAALHEADDVARALERIEGHVEWGVKIYWAADAAAVTPATSGRDYLAKKSTEASQREQARARRHLLVAEAHTELADVATAAVVNAPQHRALSGRREPMLLNAAYLVPRAGRDAFVSLAESIGRRLRGEELVVEVTGAWPAYNFVSSDSDTVPVSGAAG